MRDAASEGDDDLALAALLEPQEDIVLDISDLRRVVVLAGLQHRARCRDRVAAALDLHRVEERPVGDVVGGIDLGLEEIARLEVDEAVRPSAHRPEIVRRFSRFDALVGLEDVPGDDRAGHQPVRSRLGEDELDCEGIERFHLLDIAVDADRQ